MFRNGPHYRHVCSRRRVVFFLFCGPALALGFWSVVHVHMFECSTYIQPYIHPIHRYKYRYSTIHPYLFSITSIALFSPFSTIQNLFRFRASAAFLLLPSLLVRSASAKQQVGAAIDTQMTRFFFFFFFLKKKRPARQKVPQGSERRAVFDRY
ncbi:hypothetical protein HOY80DRAFT_111404 [Tuber brumale]|nr:hypothetical protein HOY80DRAFT_111404 [Tuber brumale]